MKRRQNHAIYALVAITTGAIAVGFAAIFAKMAMKEGLGPIATGGWRCALAIPILLALNVSFKKSNANTKKKNWAWLLIPGILFGFDLSTWHLSFQYTTAANATLLVNTAVILVSLFGWLVFKEQLRSIFWAGSFLAILGTILLVNAERLTESSDHALYGDLLALTTAIWYASYIITTKKFREKHSPITLLLSVSIGASAILFIAATLRGENLWPNNLNTWASLIGLTTIVHLGGQGLIIYSLAHIPASFAAVTLLLQPLSAGLWGWLLLSEPMTPDQIGAGLVILLGIGLAKLGSQSTSSN